MDTKELIYETVLGELDDDKGVYVSGVHIESEFAKGSRCARLYEEVYSLNRSLCAKLHVSESVMIETIISDMSEIARITGLKMYDYGAALAQKSIDTER